MHFSGLYFHGLSSIASSCGNNEVKYSGAKREKARADGRNTTDREKSSKVPT